jgi:hypothetical protein
MSGSNERSSAIPPRHYRVSALGRCYFDFLSGPSLPPTTTQKESTDEADCRQAMFTQLTKRKPSSGPLMRKGVPIAIRAIIATRLGVLGIDAYPIVEETMADSLNTTNLSRRDALKALLERLRPKITGDNSSAAKSFFSPQVLERDL